MKLLFFVPVGTSLLDNVKFTFSSDPKKYVEGSLYLDYLQKSCGTILDSFNKRPDPGDILPAEISSLIALWLSKKDELSKASEAKIMLLHSPDDEGEACACGVKKVIIEKLANVVFNGHNFPGVLTKNIRLEKIENLDPQDSKNFPGAIKKLMEIVQGEIENFKPEKTYINITGGYKALLPYLTIFGLLQGNHVSVFYLYEKSKDCIELPALPIGVDAVMFRVVYPLLENCADGQEDKVKDYFAALPPEFQGIFDVAGSPNKYEYNTFGKSFLRLFKESQTPPLVIQATKNTLIEKLGRHETEFKQLARIGESVWIGDKAPEMAEHARYHHQNLFTYAELLLLPLLAKEPNFLTEYELFILLGVIYLHDCGHTKAMLKDSRLLPTEIRTYHNLLGYERIKSNEFQQTLQNLGIKLPKEFYDVVATVAVYHRKKMPLRRNGGGKYEGPGGYTFEPLENLNGNGINGERLALLAALFRIIDGMDKQVARAGDAVEIVMKAQSIQNDLELLWDKAKRLRKVLDKHYSYAVNAADAVLLEIVDEYTKSESVAAGHSGSAPCSGFNTLACQKKTSTPKAEKCYYETLSDKIGDGFDLAWEYLDARVKCFFTALQPVYYYSDLLLDMPKISMERQNSINNIKISYQENTADAFKKCQEDIKKISGLIKEWVRNTIPNGSPERAIIYKGFDEAQAIVAGVASEYCRKQNNDVACILSKENITIQFLFNSNPLNCWNGSSP